MKKLLLIVLITVIGLSSTFAIPKDKESKKKDEEKAKKEVPIVETKPVTDDKLKQDMQDSVLEFITDLKINPDSCYIPFKK